MAELEIREIIDKEFKGGYQITQRLNLGFYGNDIIVLGYYENMAGLPGDTYAPVPKRERRRVTKLIKKEFGEDITICFSERPKPKGLIRIVLSDFLKDLHNLFAPI